MTQRIIKRLLCLVCLCGCCLGVVSAQGDMNKRAYVLFDNTGKEITYGEVMTLSFWEKYITVRLRIGWNLR